MMPLSKYFTREEFACKCGCGFDAVDAELLHVLDGVREYFNAPVTINSGCRCQHRNDAVGGKPKSLHLHGKAADIVVKGVATASVVQLLNVRYPDCYGVGLYDSWVHIDVRETKSRWGGADQ